MEIFPLISFCLAGYCDSNSVLEVLRSSELVSFSEFLFKTWLLSVIHVFANYSKLLIMSFFDDEINIDEQIGAVVRDFFSVTQTHLASPEIQHTATTDSCSDDLPPVSARTCSSFWSWY